MGQRTIKVPIFATIIQLRALIQALQKGENTVPWVEKDTGVNDEEVKKPEDFNY